MNEERWQQVKTLLDEVLEVPKSQRPRYLERRGEGNERLIRDVQELLALETEAAHFIEEPIFNVHGRGDASDRVGERLGQYRLVREVGHGGMGTVYLAERADEEFDQRVAIKVLKRGLDTDEVIRRFRNERQILAGFEHPHVARLLDGGTTGDGLPYLVMEYVEGRPIDVYCREENLGVTERLDLFLAVCSAVEEAHRRLVVHRDLKPRNILVTEDGTPKLLDFGIAKLLQPGESDTQVTVAGWRFLTPQYASPEQVAGGQVTTGTDVYSLGVILYQLLTDHRPYELPEHSVDGLAQALAAGAPPAPSTRAPEGRAGRLRGDLDNITLMALRQDPERRYANVDQLSEDLRRYRAGKTVRAAPDSLGYRVGKFVRRHRVGVAMAVAFVSLVIAFGVVSWGLLQQARQEERVATEATEFLSRVIREVDPNTTAAETTVLQALDKSLEDLGDIEAPETRSRLLLEIGSAYVLRGRHDQAEEFLNEAMKLRLELHGPDDPRLIDVKNELAGNIMRGNDSPRFAYAESLVREAIALRRRHPAAGEPSLLALKTNLADILAQQGEYEEADELYVELVDGWREAGNLFELSTILNSYGKSLVDRNRPEEALERLRRAVELRRQERGDKHTRLAMSLNNLAAALERTGRLEEAAAAYAEALAIVRDRYPEGHSDLLGPLNNQALLKQKLGQPEAAVSLMREAVDVATRIDDFYTEWIRHNLAKVQIDVDPRQAETTIREALRRQSYQGRNAWRRESMRSVLGEALAAQGRYREAESLLTSSYTALADAKGADSPPAEDALRRVVEMYEAWGKPELAAPYRRPAEGDAAVA